MLEIKPGQYILGLWFVRHNPDLPVHQRQDWMCMVWKECDPLVLHPPAGTPPGPWLARYRIARHVSEGLRKHGAPVDPRTWWSAEIDGSLSDEVLLAKMEAVATDIAAYNGVPVDAVWIQGDAEKALALLRAQPWFHDAPLPDDTPGAPAS